MASKIGMLTKKEVSRLSQYFFLDIFNMQHLKSAQNQLFY